MALFQALRERSFVFLWLGQSISVLGDRLFKIALIWWVLQTTGSGEAVGGLAIATAVPLFMFLLVGGVIVDRLPRTRVMIISDVVRGILTAMLALLAYTDHLELVLIYGIVVVFGFVEAFFRPAYSALVPEVVAKPDLPSANSLTILSWQLAGIAGPALGAILVGTGRTALAFAVNSASFFVSAISLLIVRPPPLPKRPRRHPLTEMREGIGVVLASPWLWITMLFYGTSNAIDSGLYNVSLPFVIKESLGLDIGSLGLVQSAAGIGAVAGAVWLGRRGRLPHRSWFLYGFGLIVCGCYVVMGLATSIYGIAAAALVRGVCINSMFLVWLESAQSTVERDKLGRVASIDSFTGSLMMMFSYWVAGWASDHVQPRFVFLGAAAIVATLAVTAFTHPKIRRFD